MQHVSISIIPFIDVRKGESKEKNELFNKTENRVHCVNLEAQYLSDSVAFDISRLLAIHLQKAWCYKKAYIGRHDSADFYVSGKVVDFYGYTKLDEQARSLERAGSQHGLLGVALSEVGKKKFDSPLKTRILFADVEIRNRENAIVKRFNPILVESSERIPVVTDCNAIYSFTHEKLRAANDKLARRISKTIEEYLLNDGEILVEDEDLPVEIEKQEEISTILLINGQTGKGIVDNIDESYVTYRKSRYEPQIRILKRNVRAIVTGGDTVNVTND